ncbi:MAG: hypothetical protein K2Q10_04305, partial [Rhodospirillales bacterium]|nr:hypothetical protein [Rhodospirillales bacterium]
MRLSFEGRGRWPGAAGMGAALLLHMATVGAVGLWNAAPSSSVAEMPVVVATILLEAPDPAAEPQPAAAMPAEVAASESPKPEAPPTAVVASPAETVEPVIPASAPPKPKPKPRPLPRRKPANAPPGQPDPGQPAAPASQGAASIPEEQGGSAPAAPAVAPPAPVAAELPAEHLSSYLAEIQRRLQERLLFPAAARRLGFSGVVSVRVGIA